MIKNKKILITGGAGFIGSHLVEFLINKGNYIIILDNFNDYYEGKDKNIQKVLKDYDKTEYEILSAIISVKPTY